MQTGDVKERREREAKQEHLAWRYMMQAAMHSSNQISSWDVYITRANACMVVTTGLEPDRTRASLEVMQREATAHSVL